MGDGIGPVTDIAAVQRRTLRVLLASQVLGGVGMATGMSVGALLAADMVSVGVSGLAQSAAVVGGALMAVPATRLVRQRGRGPSLAAAYLTAAVGATLVVAAALSRSVPLLFLGYFLFGGGTAAGLQARYAAVDLSPPSMRGRHLSLVVWATTLGAVAGPNLAPIAGRSLRAWDVPPLAAPFAFSAVLCVAAAVLLYSLLRPDPLRLALGLGAPAPHGAGGAPTLGMRAALHAILASPTARLALAAMSVGHLVMVGVMAMTPVHIREAGHGPARTLRVVGIVLSLHVAGMFAFAPIVGWLCDRVGRRPVILGGVAALLAACAVSGTAGHDAARLSFGLWLLGLGWSATMVAGSALLGESDSPEVRPAAQGISDLVMGLFGATAGALSGLVVQAWGYATLALFAALATTPLAAAALRTPSPRAR